MNLCVCFGSFSDGVAFACTERGFFPNASGHSILFPSLCTFNLLNCCICRARSNGSCENHGTCQGHCCRQHEAALWWTPDFFISLIQFPSPTRPRTQKTTRFRRKANNQPPPSCSWTVQQQSLELWRNLEKGKLSSYKRYLWISLSRKSSGKLRKEEKEKEMLMSYFFFFFFFFRKYS